MKNKIIKILIIFGSIFVLIIATVFIVYLFIGNDKNENELTIYGNVDIRQADLGFRVYGRVQNLMYEEGDEIKTGDLMAVLDRIPYEETVAQRKAELKEAEADLKKYKYQFSKRYNVNSEAISREDYDDALFNLKIKESSYEAAEAALASALTNLEDTQIFCPTDGFILTRIREPGSVVNIGEPVYTLSIKEPVWIRTYVDEPNLGKIFPGMQGEVYTDTKGGNVYIGHIGFISPVAEFTPKNVETINLRTDLVYRLRLYIDNPDKWLRQGMPVTIKLKLNSPPRLHAQVN